jgi:hypothetical protein
MPNRSHIRKGTGAHRRTHRRTHFCSSGLLVGEIQKSSISMKFASSPPAPARSAHWPTCSSAPVAHTPIGGATAHQAGTTQQAMRCPTWGQELEAGMTKRSMSSFQLKLLKIIEESRFGREM